MLRCQRKRRYVLYGPFYSGIFDGKESILPDHRISIEEVDR